MLTARTPGRRLEHLTGLRFVLILWVVLFHTEGISTHVAPGAAQPVYSFYDNVAFRLLQIGNGRVHIPVAGFVVMSGFVTQWSQVLSPHLGEATRGHGHAVLSCAGLLRRNY